MKKKMVTAIVAIAILCMMPVTAFASNNVHVYILADQVWSPPFTAPRTLKFSYVSAGLDSVYPSQGTDKFEKIQVSIADSSGTFIMASPYEVLTEGAGLKELHIQEGYLNTGIVYLKFRGNTNAAAEAIVDYWGN